MGKKKPQSPQSRKGSTPPPPRQQPQVRTPVISRRPIRQPGR